jgi:hypothetical protein
MSIPNKKLTRFLFAGSSAYSFDLRLVFYPVAFLLSLQFFASLFSLARYNFNSLLALSAGASLFTSVLFLHDLKKKINISGSQLLISLLTCILALSLFTLRLNHGLFDLICPTNLLGLVTQVAGGKFPASFISFPDFAMNYHQGFIFLAGTLSYITGILPTTSIKYLYLALFILFTISLTAYFISISSKYYFLPVLLLLFNSSISPKFVIDRGWANYVNVAEYLTSNSWPLALLGFVLILFLLSDYQNNFRSQSRLFLFALCLSTVNASVFSLLLISSVLFLLVNFPNLVKKWEGQKTLLISGFFLVLGFVIPKFVPSAFLVGANYDHPIYVLKIFNIGLTEYAISSAWYVFLSSPLALMGLYCAQAAIRKRKDDFFGYLSILLITSYFFPLLILFKNINDWDNIHKFAIFNILLSALIVVVSLNPERKILNRKPALIGLIGCLLLSLPADYDLAKSRFSLDFGRLIYPDSSIFDITSFLKNQSNKNMLLPFKMDDGDMCKDDSFAAIAQYSGFYLKNNYHNNFLLSPKLESQYAEDNWWTNYIEIDQKLRNLSENEYIIIKKIDRDEFLRSVAPFKKTGAQLIDFKNFSLWQNKP